MSQTFDLISNRVSMRQRATAKLNGGGLADRTPVGMPQALKVLYELASSPSTASDALALLHELQVYQVELDMQQEELHHTRSELEAALMRKTALIDHAPAGLISIDPETVLHEINLAGARLLGASPDELLGRQLTSLLSAPSATALQSMLARTCDGLMPETCELLLVPVKGKTRAVHATVGKDTLHDRFLLILIAVA